MSRFRIGADVGGTFTDVMIVDDSGHDWILKVPTDPDQPANSVLEGIRSLLRTSACSASELEHFVHGTTVALNTLLQRSGAKVGLLVTDGFEDLLEIGRNTIPVANNFYADKYPPIVRRDMVRGIQERLLRDGSVHQALDESQVVSAASELAAHGAEALVICFVHAFRNPSHERRARELIERHLPGVYVCASTDLWPVQREYERATLATINAHIGEKMRKYFDGLTSQMRNEGIRATVFSMKSNGGVMSAEMAAERPAETLVSGPAAGVMGAAFVGLQAGFDRLVGLDVGGTSADISIIDKGLGYTTETRVGDFPIMVPSVEVTSIGAGGGSIAWVDEHGVLKVGPKSAGSNPGPACYGQGGKRATVTDAYVANGWIDPEKFLGGTQLLHGELALRALGELGALIGLDAPATADAILTVASSNMYAHMMPLLGRAGVDLREYALLTYGGAGPTHGFALAKEIGIWTVIVPPTPGTLCALGCLVADLRGDFPQTILVPCAQLKNGELEGLFRRLESEAGEWLDRQKAAIESVSVIRSADMRYLGQSFEIEVPLTGVPLNDLGLTALHRQFHETYQRIYKTSDPSEPVEIINLRVQVIGQTPKPVLNPPRGVRKSGRLEPVGWRDIRMDGRMLRAAIHHREGLLCGDRFTGPCIVDQYDTTSVIPPGFEVIVDPWGNLVARQS